MRTAARNGLLTLVHAENGDVIELLTREALAAGHTGPEWHARTRPSWGAVEASLRAVALAAQAGSPLYLVHMNAGGEVDMLEYARRHGLPAMGETCPQYLFLTGELLSRPDGAKWVCSPPLRAPVRQRPPVAGAGRRRPAGAGDGPLPLFLRRQAPDPLRRQAHRHPR